MSAFIISAETMQRVIAESPQSNGAEPGAWQIA
jgi:hypothetical protein